MGSSLRAKLVVGLTAALLVLGVIVALSYLSAERFIETGREATAARERLLLLEETLSAARDLEIGQRGFLVTGEERYLEPYSVALRRVADVRSRLDSLARAGGADPTALAQADRLLERKLGELAATIRVYRSDGPEAARTIVRTDEGRLVMDSLRGVVLALEAEQTESLARLNAGVRRGATRTLRAVAALSGAAVVLFAAVCLLLWQAIEEGRRRERALERERGALDQRVREQTAEVSRLNADLTQRIAEMETLFAVVPIGIGFALDPECRDIRLNPAFARMLELSPGENASKSGPEADRLPFRVVDYDGREIPGDDLVMQRAARTGRPVHNEAYQVVHPDGRAIDMLGSAAPLFDPEGRVRGAVGAFVNVSERKRLDEQMQHAQRLQAVGQLAGGVAHEVNNMMTAVLGFAEFALQGVGVHHPVTADLREVLAAARRAADVAQQLLAFSRRQVAQPRVVRIDAVVEELRPTLERLVGANVQLIIRPMAEGTRVLADTGQLHQVLINLAANARDAMPEGGRLTVETRNIEIGPGRTPEEIELPAGSYALLAVTDTGAGMDPVTRRRAFEPFFTTKAVGSGTGLGLSIVYGIVKQAGGEVRLASQRGQGTTAEVYLPLIEEETEAVPPAAPVPGPGSSERILLVEDDAVVRALAQRALEAAGYEVVATENGRQAIRVLEDGGATVDLVVTDVVMPQLGGRALGRILAARYPGLPVLYISSYTGEDVIGRRLLESTDFLPKPFTPDELVRRVRERLDRVPDPG